MSKNIDWSCKHNVLIKNADGSFSRMDEPYYQDKELKPGIWQILSSGDFSYCIAAGDEGIAIDTGYGAGNIREHLEELTGMPVRYVINSHSHFDHTANNGYFDKAYMAAKAIPAATVPFASFAGIDFITDYERVPVGDGTIISVGNKELEIFDIPDHSADGIAVLDRADRVLFTGDEFMVFGKILRYATVAQFYSYTRKLLEHVSEFDMVCAGGGVFTPDIIINYDACAKKILDGERGQLFDHKAPRPGMLPPGPNGELVYDRMMPHFGDGGAGKMGLDPKVQYKVEFNGATIIYSEGEIE